MLVEIAICTRNRAEFLAATLDRCRQLTIPPEMEWRLLLVDNGSTDRTADFISQAAGRLPILHLEQPIPGHSKARNTAIDAAKGELLLWTDDDCLLPTDWVERYVQAASDRSHDFWGGGIQPVFEGGMPDWIQQTWEICRGCFAYRDLGDQPVEFHPDRLPYGANFAVRTGVQRQFRFDETLGRQGRMVLGDDELNVMRRMLAAGHRGYWVPGNAVEHWIPANRATCRYVYDYYVGQGFIDARSGRTDLTSEPATTTSNHRWRRAMRLRCEWWWNRWMYRMKKPWVSSHTWVSHLVQSALAQGRLQGLARVDSDST